MSYKDGVAREGSRGRWPTTGLLKDQLCLALRFAFLEHLAYLYAVNRLVVSI